MTDIAIIFDHDGVMLDTEPLHSQAWVDTLKKYSVSPRLHENGLVHKVGITIKDNWEFLLSQYDLKEDIGLLEAQRGEIYLAQLKRAKPMEGLRSLLNALYTEKKKGYLKIAIGSSSNREYIESALQNLGFTKYFDLIISGKEVIYGKPAPDIYQKASSDLGISPEKCIVLEDTPAGIMAAISANMKVIAIPNEYTTGNDFSKADIVVSSLKEIDINLLFSLI